MKNTSRAICVDDIDWRMCPLLVKLPATPKCPFFGQCDGKGIYKECIKEIKDVYKHGNFKLTKINCNNEFCSTMRFIASKRNPPV
eukprot:4711876-Ditylum_brightwellii.AAC.1